MGKEERKKIIDEIQKKRGAYLITYVTSTRQNLEVPMAMDSIRIIFEQIKISKIEKKKNNIDLFLCSNGGDGTVPWRLVTLLREYAKEFSVLIPFRAFSAATLTALGADKVFMHPMGMLGPTDPTVGNPFNPKDEITKEPIGISVEDVSAYIALIKEDVCIHHEDELVQAFNILANKVHPLALGNVKRSLAQSRLMAKKLLALHMDVSSESHKINEIVNNLTSKSYYHGHPINRTEAKEQVGLPNIMDVPEDLEKLIWDLYVEYENEIKPEIPFSPVMEFITRYPSLKPGEQAIAGPLCAKLGFIESKNQSDVLHLEYQIAGGKAANGTTGVNMAILHQGWVQE